MFDREGGATRLTPVAEADAALGEHLDTHGFVNEDGTPYQPEELPTGVGEHDDDGDEEAR